MKNPTKSNGALVSSETEKNKSLAKRILSVCFHVLWVAALSIIISGSSQIIYEYSRYSSFFVNGESMYPTLNSSVTYEGAWKAPDDIGQWGDFMHQGTYICDYGLMDDKPGFINSFKRFDIAVTYYPSDIKDSGELYASASLKIKRIIGMPGDTLYFNESGDLYINDEYVEQTFALNKKERTSYKNSSVMANYGVKIGATDKSITLKEGEYFLVGDNRNYSASDDSRFVGPISEKCLQGKAIAITAKCKYVIENGNSSSSIIWNTIKMPWNIIEL